jgi:TonB family protein
LLVRADTLRRYSFEKKDFYESYAVVYAVSSRTGRLVFWKLINAETETAEKSERKLPDSINDLSAELSDKLKVVAKEESNEKPAVKLEELPAENSPEAKNFRPPLPYQRVKPEYTRIANFYSAEATVDIEVDVDENGKILKTEIVRWAGFGLDESVSETVRKMQWRAASRDGKTLPFRVLLRYNFKKIDRNE